MRKFKIAFIYLSVALLSGCTSEKEIIELNHELSSVTEKLKLSQEKVKVLETINSQSTFPEEPFNEPRKYESDAEMQAITYKLLTKNFTSNYETGEVLPLLHSLILAEHLSSIFSYTKRDLIEKTNPKIDKYFKIPDGTIDNYFLHLKFSKSIDLPIYVRNDPGQILTDEILLVIDPEKAVPDIYIKTKADLFNSYELDARGMRSYNSAAWINPLVEHMELLNTE